MAFDSLREFTDHLEAHNDMLRTRVPLSPHLEVTEVHRRLIAQEGPALLCEAVLRPDGSFYDIPLLVNLFGAQRRIMWGMGTEDLRELGRLLAFLRQPTPPESMREALTMAPALKTALSMRPRIVKKASCQEKIVYHDEIDLLKMFPIQTCWPGEPAPLITWPLVVTQGADASTTNVGVYRMQVLGPRTTLMRWLKHRGGAQHYSQWKEPMPAAVVIGADPATMLSAVAPVPETLSEYNFSGLLRRKRLDLVPCVTVPLHVPAEAEIVIEGHVSLDQRAEEGPYGDHTGYYNAAELFPIFEASAVTMRRDPLYVSTYTGRPPDEPSVLGEAFNELFIPLIQQQYPEIVDFWLPPEGCSYRMAVLSMKKRYPGHARWLMMGAWSYLRQFMYTKWIIVVDDDIDARDWKDVAWALSTRVDPKRDITLLEGTPIDYLDFASPKSGLGSKIGIDATNKWPPEVDRPWGKKLFMDQDVVERVDALWPDLWKKT